MIEKLKLLAGNEKRIEVLFILMLLSFPFGSFFLSFSIGFMTIYPFLVLLLILSFLSFWLPKENKSKTEKYYLWFVLLFFVYALAFLPFVEGKHDAIIDLRSIGLMLMTTWVFISVKRFFGFEKWRKTILFAFYMVFILVTVFALFEMNTGWHLEGDFTEKLAARYIKDSLSNVPVFLWDNPNTFTTYYLLIGGGIIVLEPESPRKKYMVAIILIFSLMFSVVASARLGQAVVCIAGFIYLFYYMKNNKTGKLKSSWLYLIFLVFATSYTLFTNEIYTEIPHSRLRRVKVLEPVYPVPSAAWHAYPDILKPEAIEIAENVDVRMRNSGARNSLAERIALIKNGIDFFKESNFLGVGPGQYRYRHNNAQINHYVFGNNGAHFWFVELFSQYGVIIFSLYLVLLSWIFVCGVKFYRNSPELSVSVLTGLILLVVSSVLPSAFLILDINWIFTVILIIAVSELTTKKLGSG